VKIAIVGSQGKSFSEVQKKDAIQLIQMIIELHTPDMYYTTFSEFEKTHFFISGGEPTGVDTWAESHAVHIGWTPRIFHPAPRVGRDSPSDWERFKARNIQVAEACDILYAIRSTKSTTYGSGWTADYAEKLGKEVHRYYV
jgi:hypothetical protein